MPLKHRIAATLAAFLAVTNSFALSAQDAPPPPQQYRMRVTSELVLVNVVARDHHGNLIRNRSDYRQIVRDEHIGEPETRLQVRKQLKDLTLD